MLLCGYCFYKINNGIGFDTSILSLLPADQKDPVAEKVINEISGKISKKQVFLFQHKDFQKAKIAANSFCNILRSQDVKQSLVKVSCAIDPKEVEKIKKLFFNHRYHLMADSFADKIASTVDREVLISSTLKDIYAPFTPRIGSIMEDPFNHSMEWFKQLGLNSKTYIKDGFVTAKDNDQEWLLVFVETRGDPFSISTQQSVSELVSHAIAQVQKESDDVEKGLDIVKSGLLFHALHGSNTARSEISTIGIGSMLLIGLALLAVFRRPIKILYAFIPTFIGCLFAFSISLLVFERINLITMVFGASLVGVSIDYALHFLCELNADEVDSDKNSKRGGNGETAIKKIFSGLVLGLVSSCIAYGALALAPFPGIRQMSLFAVAGLVGSWLTVICWFALLKPYYKRAKNTDRQTISEWIYVQILRVNNCKRNPLPIILIVAVLVSITCWYGLKTNDSIAVLNNPSLELKQSEKLIRKLLSPPSSTQFIIVSAKSEQELLEKEEQVTTMLGDMVKSDELEGYNAVSDVVPSYAAQRENYKIYGDQLYSESGAVTQLFSLLGLPKQEAESVLRSYAENKDNLLSAKEWLVSPAADAMGYQWIGETEFGYLSVITLTGINGNAVQTMLENKIEGVRYIDKVKDISSILRDYRQIIIVMLVAAYIAVFLLLALRYKAKAIFILLAPLLASIFSVFLLTIIGIELNIFCILALLLVLGIGLDYGIFLKESNCSKESVFAVVLSCYTTICSFGFLSMSNTPVLKFFGLTLLIGILLVWIFTIVLYRYQGNK